ncbi:MAG: YHS domain-containing protein [Alphaproteobacteria bacterium]|nr:YHS domain-containing protein [Alphaproteobacteria bacterium]
MNTRTVLTALAAIGLSVGAMSAATSPAFALVPTSASAVNTDTAGIAVHGYDVVAYFTEGKPRVGSANFTATYEGARYQFASAANLKAFQANPTAYAPGFGGFCAMGVALEKKLDGDPKVWKIVDGKLYLNVNKDVSVAWQRDIPGNLAKANENWPAIKDKTPESLN